MDTGNKDYRGLKEMGFCLVYLMELGGIYFLSIYSYDGIFDIGVFGVIALITAIINFFLWKSFRKNEWMVWFPILQLLLVLILPTVFWISKPEYTFSKAKTIIEMKKDFLKGYELVDEKIENEVMLDSPNILIRRAYLMKAKNGNGLETFIYFDPVRKTYKFIEKTTTKPIMF